MSDLDTLASLDGLTQRAESCTWEVLTASGVPIGELHPEPGAVIANNASATDIKRTVTGLILSPSEYADLNPFVDRIRPSWRMRALGVETSTRLGVFRVADDPLQLYSWGDTPTLSLVDDGLLLAQTPPTTVSFDVGTLIAEACRTVATLAGVTAVQVDNSGLTFATPQVFPVASSTTYAKILAAFATSLGFLAPYFDRSGTLIIRAIDAAAGNLFPTLDYTDGRVIDGSARLSNDRLKAPNRYIVVSTGATSAPVVGVYDVPASAPHSFENRGFRLVRQQSIQGVTTVLAANRAAQAMATQEAQAYETFTFQSPVDPRHDTFDIVRARGVIYRETGWRITARAGGTMEHTLKRTFV